MIDNDALTRSDIISHLDFFINQRRNQHRFEKCESGQEFVSEYKTSNNSKYGVDDNKGLRMQMVMPAVITLTEEQVSGNL